MLQFLESLNFFTIYFTHNPARRRRAAVLKATRSNFTLSTMSKNRGGLVCEVAVADPFALRQSRSTNANPVPHGVLSRLLTRSLRRKLSSSVLRIMDITVSSKTGLRRSSNKKNIEEIFAAPHSKPKVLSTVVFIIF